MTKETVLLAVASVAFLACCPGTPVEAQQSAMSFFITSVGLGKGGDLGGLEFADRHCRSLAEAGGAGR